MELLPFLPLFSILLLVVAGLGSVALSMAVWRRRRQALQGEYGLRRTLYRVLLPLGFLGSLLILVSLTLRSFFPRQGEIFARQTLVVRADAARGQPELAQLGPLPAGAPVVRFHLAGDEAGLAALRLEVERLRAERQRLRSEPFVADPALVRARQELVVERRHLTSQLRSLHLEGQRLAQQTHNEILEKRVQRGQVRTQLAEFTAELDKLAAELDYARLLGETGQGMLEEEVISNLQHADERRRFRVALAERKRLQDEHGSRQELLAELETGIGQLEAAVHAHQLYIAESLETVQCELAVLRDKEAALATQEAQELERQKQHRLDEAAALDLACREAQERLRSLEERGAVLARHAGEVLWAHPAPAGAATADPILLFGSKDAIRARFRLTSAEASQLAQAGDVELFVTSREVLEPRLRGRLAGTRDISHEAGMVVAELHCSPSEDQLRYLARGHSLDARLDWAPPFWMDPLFLAGLLLFSLALLPQLQLRRPAALHRPKRSLPRTSRGRRANGTALPPLVTSRAGNGAAR